MLDREGRGSVQPLRPKQVYCIWDRQACEGQTGTRSIKLGRRGVGAIRKPDGTNSKIHNVLERKTDSQCAGAISPRPNRTHNLAKRFFENFEQCRCLARR